MDLLEAWLAEPRCPHASPGLLNGWTAQRRNIQEAEEGGVPRLLRHPKRQAGRQDGRETWGCWEAVSHTFNRKSRRRMYGGPPLEFINHFLKVKGRKTREKNRTAAEEHVNIWLRNHRRHNKRHGRKKRRT